jgi:hypothetical protein
LIESSDALEPAASGDFRDTGVDPTVLSDVELPGAYLVPRFNTE